MTEPSRISSGIPAPGDPGSPHRLLAGHRSRFRWACTAVSLVLFCALVSGCSILAPRASVTPGGLISSGPAIVLPTPQATYSAPDSPDRQQAADTTSTLPGVTNPPPGTGLQRYFEQRIDWTACGEFSCANVLAPLDWNNPDGPAITLAMKERKGTGKAGYLFINPGGPGGSAQDFVDSFKTTGLEDFNIVGLDSRGSGDSTPVQCGTAAQTDAYFDADWSPDNDHERTELLAVNKDFAQECRKASGSLLDHVSTIETAYDYDMVRQLLGIDKLNFYGASYGTFVGAVYDALYPNHAGRLVLDSAVNITDDQSVQQVDGFETALNEYATWCAKQSDCSLGSTQSAVTNTINEFLKGLDGAPVKVGDRTLTQSLATDGVALYLYAGSSAYQNLSRAIEWAQQGNGSYLLTAADELNGRQQYGGYSSIAYAFPAISCLDQADDGSGGAYQYWTTVSKRDPVFGFNFGPDLTCTVWTAKPAPQINFSGAGGAPVLVIGATGDNATPYQYAQWMAETLKNATLLTRDGVGHVSYGDGDSCVDSAVVRFLVDGSLPASGATCKS